MKTLQFIGLFIIACLIAALLGWAVPKLWEKIMFPALKN